MAQRRDDEATNGAGAGDQDTFAGHTLCPAHRVQRDGQRLGEDGTAQIQPRREHSDLVSRHYKGLREAALHVRHPCGAAEIAGLSAHVPSPLCALAADTAGRGRMNRHRDAARGTVHTGAQSCDVADDLVSLLATTGVTIASENTEISASPPDHTDRIMRPNQSTARLASSPIDILAALVVKASGARKTSLLHINVGSSSTN